MKKLLFLLLLPCVSFGQILPKIGTVLFNRQTNEVTCSSYQLIGVNGGFLYLSKDCGNTWNTTNISGTWYGVSISSTGQYQTAVNYKGYIYVSSDYGTTWGQVDSQRTWFDVSISD